MAHFGALFFVAYALISLTKIESQTIQARSSKLCYLPEAPPNGDVACDYISSLRENYMCVFSCNPGYVFNGLADETVSVLCYNNTLGFVREPTSPPCVKHASSQLQVTETPAHQASCVTWGTDHYRTFDKKVYTFHGQCRYLLVMQPHTFDIMVVNDHDCDQMGRCKRGLDVFFGDASIQLRSTPEGPTVLWNGQVFQVPGSKTGTIFEQVGKYLVFRSALGFTINWDGKDFISIQVSESLKGKVKGLCGSYNNDPTDDFESADGKLLTSVVNFAASWKKTDLSTGQESCSEPTSKVVCKNETQVREATERCNDILMDRDFQRCHPAVDPNPYYVSCKHDCCGSDGADCMCKTLAAYSRACIDTDIEMDWRKPGRCDVTCPSGMEYKECGSSCLQDCKNPNAVCSDSTCIDGCFCPDGQVLHKGRCIYSYNCPCEHNGMEYQDSDSIKEDCNTCTCEAGKWSCSKNSCGAICSVTGSHHFVTFDGSRYDFHGSCSYYLMKDTTYNVIVDHKRCGHSDDTCAKSVSVNYQGQHITLDHMHQLYVNGQEVTSLPYKLPGFTVSMVSSLYMELKLPNEIVILWDGKDRIDVKAPPSLKGKTKGLCGTYDGKQNNDFSVPSGITETNPNIFGNHWKAEKSCVDISTKIRNSPCDNAIQRKEEAKNQCKALTGEVFKACHDVEDVEDYYKECMSDICSCTGNLRECLCSSLAYYADICATKGVKIQWRNEIDECKVQCPPGQVYQVCGRPCERTCRNMAENDDPLCNEKCVEGCNCPNGESLNDNGECVPVEKCSCIFDGREYPAGFTTLMGLKFCTCTGAKWNCDKVNFNKAMADVRPLCPEFMEFTSCKSSCPATCARSDDWQTCDKEENCRPGCVCQNGFVLDGDKCVNRNLCPCHHGGKSYYEGDAFFMDCNKCTCQNQQWQCEAKDCPATCSAYGDSHYSTFDGRKYEFQGSCDYILAQSTISNPELKFTITIKNIQCGTSGVACSKGVDFFVGQEGSESFYNLQLIKGKRVTPDPRSPFKVEEIGEMIYVAIPSGISLQWDKGTRLYVKADTRFMNKVEGLCGNFNGDRNDDFTLPQGGPPVAKATLFGDSWKVHSYCEASKTIVDTCELSPQRRAWSQLKCSILASELFEPCHGAVPYEDFKERCEFDACACDQGGDCECLCTSIAAYAHECATHGIVINWRTKHMCSLECSECKTYNSCMSRCPKKTCENRLFYDDLAKNCQDEPGVCFEGCDLHPCPEGQVYDSLVEPVSCVPEPLCDSPACDINGKKYREGERIDDPSVCQLECEICNCRNGKLDHITFGSCTQKAPPTHLIPSPPTVTPPLRPPVKCITSGWTPWLSSSVPTHANTGDRETKEGLRTKYSFCANKHITDIHCRVISQPDYGVYFGQNVSCNLDTGFTCQHKDQMGGFCLDYEVSFYCKCKQGDEVTTVSTTSTPEHFSTPTRPISESTSSSASTRSTSEPPSSTKSTATSTSVITSKEVPSSTSSTTKVSLTTTTSTRDVPSSSSSSTTKVSFATTPSIDVPSSTASTTETSSTTPTTATSSSTASTSEASSRVPSTSATPSSSSSTAEASTITSSTKEVPSSTSPTTDASSTTTSTTVIAFTTPSTTRASTSMTAASSSTASTSQASSTMTSTSVTPSSTSSKTEASSKEVQSSTSPTTEASSTTTSTTVIPFTTPSTTRASTSMTAASSSTASTSRASSTMTSTPEIPSSTSPKTEASSITSSTKEVPSSTSPTTEASSTTTSTTVIPFTTPSTTRESTSLTTARETPPSSTSTTQSSTSQTTTTTTTTTTTITTELPISTPKPFHPSCGWTRWMNSYTPDANGEMETMSNLRLLFSFCEHPVRIMCRTAPTAVYPNGISFDEETQNAVSCDLNRGLVCVNSLQQNGEACYDYEVSVQCVDSCTSVTEIGSTTTPVTDSVTSSSTSSSWYQSSSSSPSVSTATSAASTTPTSNKVSTHKSSSTPSWYESSSPSRAVSTSSPTPGSECMDPVGLSNQDLIQEDQFDASSSIGIAFDSHNGRLYNIPSGPLNLGAWMPRPSDPDPNIVIDLKHPMKISGIITQGRPDQAQWVTKYTVFLSEDGVSFIPYEEDGGAEAKVFDANVDSNTLATNMFKKPVIVQKVAIHPQEFFGSFALRLELLTCSESTHNQTTTETSTTLPHETTGTSTSSSSPTSKIPGSSSASTSKTPLTPSTSAPPSKAPEIWCNVSFNVETPEEFPSRYMTASSFSNILVAPWEGRLWNKQSAWVPRINRKNQWLQIDFQSLQDITGIKTQGHPKEAKWISSFYITYSADGYNFKVIKNDLQKPFVLRGNVDMDSAVENTFPEPISARFVRIYPMSWALNGIALRLAYYGCLPPNDTAPTPPPSVKPRCEALMGVGNTKVISDVQLTASSQADENSGPENGRALVGKFSGSWVASPVDKNPWIQVDFLEPKVITGVLIQGHGTEEMWVESFLVQYSSEGNFFSTIQYNHQPQTFIGNDDKSTVLTNFFQNNIRARFIRIAPLDFHGGVALRFEVMGCNPSPPFPPPIPPRSPVCNNTIQVQEKYIKRVDQLTASDYLDEEHSPAHTLMHDSKGSWIPRTENNQPWIQVQFDEVKVLYGVATEGSPDSKRWVSKYNIFINDLDKNAFIPYSQYPGDTEPVSFRGNSDQNSVVLGMFNRGIVTDKIRLVVLEHGLEGTGLRFDLISCEPDLPIKTTKDESLTTTPAVTTVTSPKSTSEVVTTLPPCTKNFWLPFVSRSFPETSDGDREYMTPSELDQLCVGGLITEISCYTIIGTPYAASGDVVECNLENGLTCSNEENKEVCQDYKIRYWCQCHPESTASGTTATTTSSSTTTTMSKTSPTSGKETTQTSATPSKPGLIESTASGTTATTTSSSTTTTMSKTSPTSGKETTQTSATPSKPGLIESTASGTTATTTSSSTITTMSKTSPTSGKEITQTSATPSKPGLIESTASGTTATTTSSSTTTTMSKTSPTSGKETTQTSATPSKPGLIGTSTPPSEIANVTHEEPSLPTERMSTPPSIAEVTYKTPSISTDTSIPTKPTPPERIQVRCAWSPWLNTDKPKSNPGDEGDMETISALKSTFGICPRIVNIQCRIAGTTTQASVARQTGVHCDPMNGLRCYNRDTQARMCYDYEVSVLCWSDSCRGSPPPPPIASASTTTTTTTTATTTDYKRQQRTTVVCPPGQVWLPCAYSCDDVCINVGQMRGACKNKHADNCVPGCKPVANEVVPVCPQDQRLNDNGACVPKETCSCLKPDNTVAKPLETWTNPDEPCSQCSCFNNEVVCDISSVSCTPPLSSTTTSTSSPPSYDCGWSDWINTDTPDTENGDMELLSSLHKTIGICVNPVSVECREAGTNTSAKDLRRRGMRITCNHFEGLKCFKGFNHGKCVDFEIRVFCPCSPTTAPSTISTSATNEDITAVTPKPQACGWTEWVNDHTPDSRGDYEYFIQLQRQHDLCNTGSIIAIECRDNVTKKSAEELNQKVQCNINYGLVCFNYVQLDNKCADYEVRIFCDPIGSGCSLPSTPEVSTISTFTTVQSTMPGTPSTQTSSEPICDNEMGLKDGRIRDNMISSSSNRDYYHSSSSVRLDSGNSWMPNVSDKNQFIQIDFGIDDAVITGIIVQGSPATEASVTSYKIIFSSDGKTWNSYSEGANVDKIFRVDWKSTVGLKEYLRYPLRTRVIRIVPITWNEHISMRMELIGCPTVYPSPTAKILTPPIPSTPRIETPPINENCIDWNVWVDLHHPTLTDLSDIETIGQIKEATPNCTIPMTIECRTATPHHIPYYDSGQTVRCNLWEGLVCQSEDLLDGTMCLNYEVRLGCVKMIPECINKHPPTLPPPTQLCYPGLDPTHCPKDGCDPGHFCDGSKCVHKSECPCLLEDKAIRPTGITTNKDCEICQCLNGEVICMPKTCSSSVCKKGHAVMNFDTCNCECHMCADDEFQCGNGHCISLFKRCDGFTDCGDDEINCETTPSNTTTGKPTEKITLPYTTPSIRKSTTEETTRPYKTTPVQTSTTEETTRPYRTTSVQTSTTKKTTWPYRTTSVQTSTTEETTLPYRTTPVQKSTTKKTTRPYRTTTGQKSTTEETTWPKRTTPVQKSTTEKTASLYTTPPVENFTTSTTYRIETPRSTRTPQRPPINTPDPCNYPCPEPQMPPLQMGMSIRLTKTADDCCYKYLVCDPNSCQAEKKECSAPYVQRELQGMGDDCCPHYDCVCPASCPVPTKPKCPLNYEIIEINGDCTCPELTCHYIPECRYTRKYNMVDGYPVEFTEPHTELFKPGDSWSDGPCKSCLCSNSSGTLLDIICQKQLCSPCPIGYRMVEEPNSCCGKCEPYGCLVGNIVYNFGDQLPSPKKCYTKSCERDVYNKGFIVRETQVNCESFDKLPICQDNAQAEELLDKTGCCMACMPREMLNSTDACSKCSPQPVFGHPKYSIGYFMVTLDSGITCKNEHPLADLKKCMGYCLSGSAYTHMMRELSQCQSCQTATSRKVEVTLTCSDGSSITRHYDMPETCSCTDCFEFESS